MGNHDNQEMEKAHYFNDFNQLTFIYIELYSAKRLPKFFTMKETNIVSNEKMCNKTKSKETL